MKKKRKMHFKRKLSDQSRNFLVEIGKAIFWEINADNARITEPLPPEISYEIYKIDGRLYTGLVGRSVMSDSCRKRYNSIIEKCSNKERERLEAIIMDPAVIVHQTESKMRAYVLGMMTFQH